MLYPKLLTTLKDYSWPAFWRDAQAGFIVGIVALPLAIAFAIASGVSPDRGLITAVIAGLIISILGGSRVQIGGPTGAFVVIVYAVVQKHGLEGLWVATIMAGLLLVVLGFAGFGGVIKFIPYPLTIGFTSGIAVIIFSSQIKDLFGLRIETVPADFLEKWKVYFEHFTTVNPYAIAVSVISFLILIFWKRISQKIPASVVVLFVSTFAVAFFHLPVETIGSRFGEIPNHLPMPVFPSVSWQMVQELSPVAFTIAILAGIESLLSAVIADGMIGGRHRSNMELIAQGVANIVTPLFGGIPATGAIARTTTNIHHGGRTPVSGIIHALTLLLIMLSFGHWAALIPLPCLAVILIVVSYHMSEWRSFLMLLKSPLSDVFVMVVTFGLTVLVDLTVAIQVGMVLSILLFVRRMSIITNVDTVTREINDREEEEDPLAIQKRKVPEGVEVYEINGPFFFGASSKFMEAMKVVGGLPKVRIIRMRNVNAIDATGIHVLKSEWMNSRKNGIPFILSALHAQPYLALDKAGVLDLIGRDNLCENIDEALARAEKLMETAPAPDKTI